MSDFSSEIIKKFIERYNNALRSKSTALRLDINFATELNSSITYLLSELKSKDEQIIKLQNDLINSKNDKSFSSNQDFDGGNFD